MNPSYLLCFCIAVAAACASATCPCQAPQSIDLVGADASIVFVGTVVGEKQSRVTLAFDVGEVSYLEKRVRFIPEKVMRGSASDTIDIFFYQGREACESRITDFTWGERYAVSAISNNKGQLCFNDCCLLVKNPVLEPAEPLASAETVEPAEDTVVVPTTTKKARKCSFFRKRR